MAGVPASTVGAYARDWKGRHWALLAGLLCGFGNGFQFMGGQAAGYAAADAVQVFYPFRASVTRSYLSHQTSDSTFGLPGVATCKHILGRHPLWGIPTVIKEDIPVAFSHAVDVRRRGRCSHCFSRA